MRTALARTAAILAATAAPLCIAAAAPASAAPTGLVSVKAALAPGSETTIVLTWTVAPPMQGSFCSARVKGVSAGGEVQALPYILVFTRQQNNQLVTPKFADLYEITYFCTGAQGDSSSNGSPIFVKVDGGLPAPTGTPGPIGGRTPFGS